MTIDEAIINLMTLRKVLSKDTDPIFLNSIQLGIEALKRYLSLKLSREYVIIKPLPGETKEQERKK